MKLIVTCPFPATADKSLGAEAVVDGVTEVELDVVPTPLALTALKLIEYVVPFVSPVIVIGEVVEPVEVQVEPPFMEYS